LMLVAVTYPPKETRHQYLEANKVLIASRKPMYMFEIGSRAKD
jgi:hypothetical protein